MAGEVSEQRRHLISSNDPFFTSLHDILLGAPPKCIVHSLPEMSLCIEIKDAI